MVVSFLYGDYMEETQIKRITVKTEYEDLRENLYGEIKMYFVLKITHKIVR